MKFKSLSTLPDWLTFIRFVEFVQSVWSINEWDPCSVSINWSDGILVQRLANFDKFDTTIILGQIRLIVFTAQPSPLLWQPALSSSLTLEIWGETGYVELYMHAVPGADSNGFVRWSCLARYFVRRLITPSREMKPPSLYHLDKFRVLLNRIIYTILQCSQLEVCSNRHFLSDNWSLTGPYQDPIC